MIYTLFKISYPQPFTILSVQRSALRIYNKRESETP